MSTTAKKNNSPIFIIGTERSGTNLLRLMLNAHGAIAVPHPPHIVKFFSPLTLNYGDLRDDGNFRLLIEDVCTMVELHPYPWEIRPDREQVFGEARERSLLCIYFAIYDQYLRSSGKRRWCCKSTFMIDHVGEIRRAHPHARFIFMVRDARDVAVSARESIFNHFHVYYSALRWQREQRTGLDWLAELPPEQITLLRYEELIASPEEEIRRLCRFLGEEFEDQMLEYHRSREAQKSASLSISWENTSRPVLRENREKFRTRLKPAEIFMIEAICLKELHELGYEVTEDVAELAARREELLRPMLSYRITDFLMSLRTEAKHLFKDRNSLLRVRKILFLKYLGLLRRVVASHA